MGTAADTCRAARRPRDPNCPARRAAGDRHAGRGAAGAGRPSRAPHPAVASGPPACGGGPVAAVRRGAWANFSRSGAAPARRSAMIVYGIKDPPPLYRILRVLGTLLIIAGIVLVLSPLGWVAYTAMA